MSSLDADGLSRVVKRAEQAHHRVLRHGVHGSERDAEKGGCEAGELSFWRGRRSFDCVDLDSHMDPSKTMLFNPVLGFFLRW